MDEFENFKSITGVEKEEDILFWFDSANYDMSQAVELFFNNNGDKSKLKTDFKSSSSENNQKSKDYHPPPSLYESELEVRKPDRVKRQKLIDDDMAIIEEKGSKKHIVTTFTSGSDIIKNEKNKTLASLFSPPYDIMTDTSFDEARDIAKVECKWLFVNIQNDQEFSCHILNRDFWNEETVKDMIKYSCIFWQKLNISSDAMKYIERYKVTTYPHVAMIDPRTGVLLWKREGQISIPSLAEKFQDFLGNHPTPEPISILNPPKDMPTTFSNIDNLNNIETSIKTSSLNETKVTKSLSFENNIAKPITTALQPPQEPIKGYCVREILEFPDSDLNIPEDSPKISLKIKFPNNSSLSKQYSPKTKLIQILHDISKQLNSCEQFDIFYNHPQVAFSEKSNKNNLLTLSDIEITSNTALTVRIYK